VIGVAKQVQWQATHEQANDVAVFS
jgi:hypothetical protein